MSQLSNKPSHNVRYDIPSFLIGAPAQQGAYPKAEMTLVPGLSYPFNILFTNVDGAVLNLTPFKVHLVFWSNNQINMEDTPQILELNRPGEIVLSKQLFVDNGYDGALSVLLDGEDTSRIGNALRSGGVKWGVFLKNDQGNVFGCEVGPNGARSGSVSVHPDSHIPLGVLEGL